MSRALVLLPFLALAACATPREACIGDVSRDLRVLNGLIEQTRGNLQRGYAVAEREEIRTRPGLCRADPDEGGEGFTFDCDRTETITRRVPVAIDLNAERAKLESLLERRDRQEAATQTAIRQCQAQYPE